MKLTASAFAISAAFWAGGVASAAEAKTVCTRGGDARGIEVVAPGEVGKSCDVRYTRGAGNVSVPYHADNSDSFCADKARALAQKLASAGFSCSAAAPALRAEATAPAVDYVVEAKRAAPQAATPVQQASAPAPEPAAIAAASTPAPKAEEMEPALVAITEEADDKAEALEEKMNEILSLPPLGEPAQLVENRAQTPAARPQPDATGRLTGAAPETPQRATPIVQAALQAPDSAPAASEPANDIAAPAPQPEEPSPAASPQKAPESQAPEKTAKDKSPLRDPRDVIRATLLAQAAAWNEGDLDGFMAGYWKSDDLKFVSGVTITKGWAATQKRYRDNYSSDEGFGHLSFDKMDVKLVTDDVAVVTGRFNLARGGDTSSGVFSLVLRRDAGVWRIVHDHTSKDPSTN